MVQKVFILAFRGSDILHIGSVLGHNLWLLGEFLSAKPVSLPGHKQHGYDITSECAGDSGYKGVSCLFRYIFYGYKHIWFPRIGLQLVKEYPDRLKDNASPSVFIYYQGE